MILFRTFSRDTQEFRIFQECDKTSEKGFVNILDKGYRITLSTNKEGQSCLQPIFAKSDEQFTRDQMLHSACVAVVRSGNERAVK